MQRQESTPFVLENQLLVLRPRLVRLCAHLSGEADAAEDLAQETLVEAWRQAHKLYDPSGYGPWLWAIARNVCLRRARRQAREQARWTLAPALDRLDAPGDGADLEIDLEREDLARLLDQALALLPAETRALLVERYIHESPAAEVAARLGLSEGAVAVRLHRGKLALRRLLSTDLQSQAATLGLVDPAVSGWQPTRTWCAVCGRHRLLARFGLTPPASIAFRCPGCQPDPGAPSSEYRLANTYFARELGGLTRPRVVLNKMAGWAHTYFRQALATGEAPCTHCGRPTSLQRLVEEDHRLGLTERPGLYMSCAACGEAVHTSFKGLVLSLPEVHAFWAQHARLRTLPDQPVEVEGRPALISRFESVTGQDALDVISARDTYEVIAVHGAPRSTGRGPC